MVQDVVKNKTSDRSNNGSLSPLGRAIGQITLAVTAAAFIAMGGLLYNTSVELEVLKGRVSHVEERAKKFREIQEQVRRDIIKLRLHNERRKPKKNSHD